MGKMGADAWRVGGMIYIVIFFLTLVLPGSIYGIWKCDSYAVGIAIASVFLSLVAFAFLPKTQLSLNNIRSTAILYLGVSLALYLHLFMIEGIGCEYEIDYHRFGYSLLLLGVVIAGSKSLSHIIENKNYDIILFSKVCIVGMLTMTLTGFSGAGIWDPVAHPKAVGVYPEPSHFALALSPFMLFLAAVGGGRYRFLAISCLGLLGIALESLLLLVVAAMTCLLTCHLWKNAIFASITLVLLYALDKHSYFWDRLDYSESNLNLSLLVYLNGWDMAWNSVVGSGGTGLGFQQLGVGRVPDGIHSDEIVRQASIMLNERDGGFLAAKVISEMGVVGILVTLIGASIGIWSSMKIRKVCLSGYSPADASENAILIFCHCVCAMFLLELLLRGGSYFTIGTVMYLAALAVLISARRSRPDALLPWRISKSDFTETNGRAPNHKPYST